MIWFETDKAQFFPTKNMVTKNYFEPAEQDSEVSGISETNYLTNNLLTVPLAWWNSTSYIINHNINKMYSLKKIVCLCTFRKSLMWMCLSLTLPNIIKGDNSITIYCSRTIWYQNPTMEYKKNKQHKNKNILPNYHEILLKCMWSKF